MVIRCERCSTMYELDESLLAADGSQVQCTRCEHVFTAFPPRAGGRALAGIAFPPPAEELDAEPAPPAVRSAPPPSSAREGAAPRPVRSVPAPVYRPPAPQPSASGGAVGRAPVLRRDTLGTFEARLRWTARWRWLAPAIAVAIVASVVAAWLLLSRRGASASRNGAEALALIALDDGASLEQAVAKLQPVPARGGSPAPATADRALALVLRAAGLAEERDALAARAVPAQDGERLRGEAQGPVEPADEPLDREVRARDERVRALSGEAAELIGATGAAPGDAPEVARAAAALHALRGERDQLERLLRAREGGGRDPWLDLADGWIDARDPDRVVRERALVKLRALAAARPDLLRGRYLLARAEASVGRRAEALLTVDGVLAANARHEGARRLREELSAAPAPAAAAPSLPAEEAAHAPAPPPVLPPAARGPTEPRKTVLQPGSGASPRAVAPAPAAEAPDGRTGAAGDPERLRQQAAIDAPPMPGGPADGAQPPPGAPAAPGPSAETAPPRPVAPPRASSPRPARTTVEALPGPGSGG